MGGYTRGAKKKYYSPRIRWVIFTPSQVATGTFKYDRWVEGCSIGTDALDDRHQITIAGVDARNGLLVAIDKCFDLLTNTKLDA